MSTSRKARVFATRATAKKKPLSPRGRGSNAAAPDPDRLLALFAENMRLVRKFRNLSQEALGVLADLDRTYVSGIERKRRTYR